MRFAKDEGRHRFIGDRCPLNSRERSIGRAHLPYCPQLRRMILGKSETVQITIGDTKDCFYLYEVPRTPLPFPCTMTIGDVYIDDLVILSVWEFSDVHIESLPFEVQRADALYTNAGKSGSALAGEFWRGHLDGVAGTLGFPHHDACRFYMGKSDALPRLLGGWAFALALGRSMCLPRHEPHCNRDSGSNQTKLSERSSDRRASPYHGTHSSVGDELEGRTLREARRYGRLTRWCWRVGRVHHAGGLAHRWIHE